MKTFILKFSVAFLLLALMGAGCEKEEDNFDSAGIVGKWQLLRFPENCVGFLDEMIEIAPDSIIKIYIDGELSYSSTFHIKKGRTGYDTIFYHNADEYYDWELIHLESIDTLQLVPPVLTITATCDYYKRKKQ
jgi:hypothetical protein